MKRNPLSEAEEMIGDFLFDINIKYEDQKEIHGLKSDVKAFRIADFYLPDFDIYIEFLGDWVMEDRKEEYKKKMQTYKANNIPCIYVWPNNLGHLNWLFKERLRAVLIEHKKHKVLFLFEIREFLKANWVAFLVLAVIGITFKNILVTIGVSILIIAICYAYYTNIKRRLKRVKERHNLN